MKVGGSRVKSDARRRVWEKLNVGSRFDPLWPWDWWRRRVCRRREVGGEAARAFIGTFDKFDFQEVVPSFFLLEASLPCSQ